ncbi:MAG: hypothetical protein FRX49_00879 [Trebouxia sp. A1-2]|nr:MAG: hypothetical protein FRX49_00879 [Trebouxia sp. A1-2]
MSARVLQLQGDLLGQRWMGVLESGGGTGRDDWGLELATHLKQHGHSHACLRGVLAQPLGFGGWRGVVLLGRCSSWGEAVGAKGAWSSFQANLETPGMFLRALSTKKGLTKAGAIGMVKGSVQDLALRQAQQSALWLRENR